MSLPSHLPKKLYRRGMEQTCAPRLDLEHDRPPGGSNGLLSVDGKPHFVELSLYPIIVGAIEMQLAQHLHRLLIAIGFAKVSWRLAQRQ